MSSELAVVQPQQIEVHATPVPSFTLAEMAQMAKVFAASHMFGIDSPEQALTLLLLAQADGIHPAKAMMEYHVIKGKPSLSADAMLARHQRSGGKVNWVTRIDEKVTAIFAGPLGEVEITWDKARAIKAGLWSKDNFQRHPAQMLAARCVSEGVKAVNPAAAGGYYTPEEAQFFEDEPSAPAPAPQPTPAVKPQADAPPADTGDVPPPLPSPVVTCIVDSAQAREITSGANKGRKCLLLSIRSEASSEPEPAVYFGEKIIAGFAGEILCKLGHDNKGKLLVEHIEATMPKEAAGA